MPQIYSLKKDISFGAEYWALPEKKMVCGDQLITSFNWLKFHVLRTNMIRKIYMLVI